MLKLRLDRDDGMSELRCGAIKEFSILDPSYVVQANGDKQEGMWVSPIIAVISKQKIYKLREGGPLLVQPKITRRRIPDLLSQGAV